GKPRETGLIADREPVPGLDLEGRRALRVQLGCESREPATQLVVACGTGRCDGATYSSGSIGRAGHARLEFLGAVASEDEVRVRVDETGEDGPAPGIHDLRSVGPRGVRRKADPRDPVALD